MNLKDYVKDIPNFPKKGIIFKDISPLLWTPEAFSLAVDKLSKKVKDADVIVWLDARWFLFAWAIAYKLQKPLVIIRKSGKLPWDVVTDFYSLEYWEASFDLQKGSINTWDKVAIIDDLLATGWTAKAACNLVERVNWTIDSISFITNLSFLNWEKILKDYKLNFLIEY